MNSKSLIVFFAAHISSLLLAYSAAAAAAVVPEFDFGKEDPHRQLYVQCKENGRDVSMGESCCMQTQSIQKDSLFDDANKCDQINADDILDNLFDYCKASEDGKTMTCSYDVQENNPDCAKETRNTCRSRGGNVFTSDFTMECEDFSLHVDNSLSCLGTSCTHKDVQEYLWVGYFTTHSSFQGCKMVELNGETLAQRERMDFISTVVGGTLMFIFVGLYLYVRCGIGRYRSLFPGRTNQGHQPIPVVQLTPTKQAQPVSKTPVSAFDAEFL